MFFKKIVKLVYILSIFLALLSLNPIYCAEYNEKDISDAKQNAYALYNTRQPQKALEILNKIPRDYQDEETNLILANIYEDLGNNSKAIEYLNKAIRINPKFYKAYYNLGCIFAKKNEYDLAINNFKKSVNIQVNFADGYYNLASCYLKSGKYNEAKKYFIRTLAHDPKNQDALYNLAYTYKQLGQKEKAQKILANINN